MTTNPNPAYITKSAATVAKAHRLGTETGSLVNHLISGSAMPAPAVGMGATILSWSDRRAATVTQVSKFGKRIAVVDDIATRVDKNGMSEVQEYVYTPGNSGPSYFTLRKNGAWVREGESMKGGQRIALGYRNTFHDFSF